MSKMISLLRDYKGGTLTCFITVYNQFTNQQILDINRENGMADGVLPIVAAGGMHFWQYCLENYEIDGKPMLAAYDEASRTLVVGHMGHERGL